MEIDEEYGDLNNRAQRNKPIGSIEVSFKSHAKLIPIGKMETRSSVFEVERPGQVAH